MGHSCHGFHPKIYLHLTAFLIYIHVITYVNCDIEYNTFEVGKLLNTLSNDRNLRTFQFYPVKIYLESDVDSQGSLESIENVDFNELLRTTHAMDFKRDKVKTSKTGRLLRYQHRKKMEEIIDFLRDRYSSTNYFYEEMKRIQSQYTIRDKMREMIDYCEHPENYKMKERILKLFEKLKLQYEKEHSVWNPKPNNLVINVLKDPYNDGVS